MSGLGAALRGYLLGRSSVSTLVGTRIYPLVLPQTPTLPAISYQIVAEGRVRSLDGVSIPNPQVQVDCWALTYDAAEALATAVVRELECYRGTMGSLRVHEIAAQDREESYETDVKNYRVSLGFSIWHT